MTGSSRHTDIVLIKGLRIESSIGVFDWEKEIKQTLLFDIEMTCDFSASAVTDDIKDAVDYAAVCNTVKQICGKQHYQLLEYLAAQISERLFASFAIKEINLAIYKPGAVVNTEYVGVKIHRTLEQVEKTAKTKGS